MLTKAELGANNPSEIVLLRFADGKWNELATTPKTQDFTECPDKTQNCMEFTAATPGFSVFVVSTKPVAPTATQPAQPPSATPKTQDSGLKTVSPTPKTHDSGPKTTPAGGDMTLIGIIGAVVVLGGIGGAVMMKKKKK
ncbi:MAG: PGF-pre-PGF domain-containing protein [Candidatus Aenigmarchaeota archaeon]|nr:PGF-pre-PGF domain-containing protein [Candidatus Aenigmarchaeota archaeon]